jgi:hypothetical protein
VGGSFHELASLSASTRPKAVSPILDTSSVGSPALATLSACLMKVALIIFFALLRIRDFASLCIGEPAIFSKENGRLLEGQIT